MDAATSLLRRACECDAGKKYFEAIRLYESGIRALAELAKAETDHRRQAHYLAKCEEYSTRVDLIKRTLEKRSTIGEVVSSVNISDGSTGHSYKSLFGKYLTNDVFDIDLQEPYLREVYQFVNLVGFAELAVKQCKSLKCIRLTTTTDPNSPAEQQKFLTGLRENLKKHGVALDIEFGNVHDRHIILSNDYIIKIGRGLHFYKAPNPRFSLGLIDYDFRECMETDVLIYRSKH